MRWTPTSEQELIAPIILCRYLRPGAARGFPGRLAGAAFRQATEKECQARDERGHKDGNYENELDGHRKPRFSPQRLASA